MDEPGYQFRRNPDGTAPWEQTTKKVAPIMVDDYPDHLPSQTVHAPEKPGWTQNLNKGGVKYDTGKLRWDLLPAEAMMEVVWNYTMGAAKYDDHNWRKGMSFVRLFGAMMRHAWAWLSGEQYDADGQHHLAAVVFCALCLLQLEREKPEFDDRFNPRTGKLGFPLQCRDFGGIHDQKRDGSSQFREPSVEESRQRVSHQ